MTARPIYREWLHTPEPRRIRPGRWAWTVGDGWLCTLGEGVTVTRWGAYRARDRFAETCRELTPEEKAFRDALDAVCERLHADGIDVSAEVDERGRVCVRPLCACSDVDHRRVLLAFCRIVGPVRWVGVSRG